jgi:putative flippase GtrA
MIKLYKKYKEVMMYLIFGVLTTLVNILSYVVFTRLFKIDVYVSNVIAWILSVLFAYVTNRKYVFNSNIKTLKGKIKEITSFYACRLLTFGIDMLAMYILIDLFNINDMLSKVVVNVIVIVLNYIFSKLIIFKK